ncbi:hypothetical protein RHGRI_021287 [Rhododendron griersonianum]|uniref:Uncharacterized protein n=1 Tax=Rhododendron griersonianum TaxID=479676 RepID=A0AAV6JQM9_9ERIC|nr:hypothetical protein RHGRI_021287 [Rhododendron griersonianum]
MRNSRGLAGAQKEYQPLSGPDRAVRSGTGFSGRQWRGIGAWKLLSLAVSFFVMMMKPIVLVLLNLAPFYEPSLPLCLLQFSLRALSDLELLVLLH